MIRFFRRWRRRTAALAATSRAQRGECRDWNETYFQCKVENERARLAALVEGPPRGAQGFVLVDDFPELDTALQKRVGQFAKAALDIRDHLVKFIASYPSGRSTPNTQGTVPDLSSEKKHNEAGGRGSGVRPGGGGYEGCELPRPVDRVGRGAQVTSRAAGHRHPRAHPTVGSSVMQSPRGRVPRAIFESIAP